MPSKWVDFVKSWAAKNNMSYKCALKDCKCKEAYRKENSIKGKGSGASVLQSMERTKIQNRITELVEIYNRMEDELAAQLPIPTQNQADDIAEQMIIIANEIVRLEQLIYPSSRSVSSLSSSRSSSSSNLETEGGKLSGACWKGYEAIGMKKKGDRKVPNCVPIKGGALSDTDIASIAFLSAMGIPLTYLVGIWAMDKLNELVEFMRRRGRVAPEYDPADIEFAGAETKEEPRDIEGGKVADWVSPTAWKDYGTAIVKGRNDYPPKMRDIIKKYGKIPITRMYACRTPVPAILTSALNAVSFGEFGRRWGEKPYDKMFHLDVRVELDTQPPVTVLLEKNEVLNSMVNPPPKGKNTECTFIPINGKQLTIEGLLEGSRQIQGDKFFRYSAYDNNCQDFIMSLLRGSGIGTQDNFDFIKQDTQELFKGLPGTRKTANTVTDLGAVVNTIIEGAGAASSVSNIMMDDLRNLHNYAKIAAEMIVENELNNPTGEDNFMNTRNQLIENIDRAAETIQQNRLSNANRETRTKFNKSIRRVKTKVYELTNDVINRYRAGMLAVRADASVVPVQVATTEDTTGTGIHKGDNYYVQSVVFKKDKFDVPSSRKWLKENKYMTKKPDVTDTEIRWRQVNPKYIEEKGYKRFRTKKIGRNSGISLIIAYK